jgi:hypothetical protein
MSYLRGKLSTVDLLVITSIDQLLSTLKKIFTFLTKQAILVRRPTVLRLPLQKVFPDPVPPDPTSKQSN